MWYVNNIRYYLALHQVSHGHLYRALHVCHDIDIWHWTYFLIPGKLISVWKIGQIYLKIIKILFNFYYQQLKFARCCNHSQHWGWCGEVKSMKGHTINQLLTNSIIVCVRSVNPSNSIFFINNEAGQCLWQGLFDFIESAEWATVT